MKKFIEMTLIGMLAFSATSDSVFGSGTLVHTLTQQKPGSVEPDKFPGFGHRLNATDDSMDNAILAKAILAVLKDPSIIDERTAKIATSKVGLELDFATISTLRKVLAGKSGADAVAVLMAGLKSTESKATRLLRWGKEKASTLASTLKLHKKKVVATALIAALLYADYAGYIGEKGFDAHHVAGNYVASMWNSMPSIWGSSTATKEACPVPQSSLTDILNGQGLSCADKQDVLSVTNYFKNGGAATDGCNGCLKPGGILISGPPGTGKTTVAKAIAQAAGCDYIEGLPADLGTPDKIQSFFASLRASANEAGTTCKAVLLDEYNNVAELGTKTLEPLLVETERSVKGNNNILFMAATNFSEKIAPSAQRSGRFDFHLRTLLPNAEIRAKILTGLLDKAKQVLPTSVVAKAGEMTAGFSFADLANTVRCTSLRGMLPNVPPLGETFMSCVNQVVKKVRG